VFSEDASFFTPAIGEVALVGAVFVALHPRVVLAEIGGRVAQVQDEAAFAQATQQFRVRPGGSSACQKQYR
jgi:hypothetical protein